MIWRQVALWSLSCPNTHTFYNHKYYYLQVKKQRKGERKKIGAPVCSSERDALLKWTEEVQRCFPRDSRGTLHSTQLQPGPIF